MAAAIVALLRALAALLEAVVAAGIVGEVARRWRAERITAEIRALQAGDQRRAQALVDGDVRALDADLVDLERDLDGLLNDTADADDHRRP